MVDDRIMKKDIIDRPMLDLPIFFEKKKLAVRLHNPTTTSVEGEYSL